MRQVEANAPLPPNVAEARTRRTILAAADYGLTTPFLKVSPLCWFPQQTKFDFWPKADNGHSRRRSSESSGIEVGRRKGST